MSFGEYLNSGTTYTKMSQNGKIPRPAGLLQWNFVVQLCGSWSSAHDQANPRVFHTRITSRDRNAWTKSSWVHSQWQTKELKPKPTWGIMCNSWSTWQSNGDPRWAWARPTGLGEAGRSLTICVEAKQLLPTSGVNQERPREGGGKLVAIPGWPP